MDMMELNEFAKEQKIGLDTEESLLERYDPSEQLVIKGLISSGRASLRYIEELLAKLNQAVRTNLTSRNLLWLCHGNYKQLQTENEGLNNELNNLTKAAIPYSKKIKQLEAELEKHRWIPVEERLPKRENHKDSLGHSKAVHCYYGNMPLAERQKRGIPFGFDVDTYNTKYSIWTNGDTPTHWKPIILP